MSNKKKHRLIDRTGERLDYITITGLSDKNYFTPTTGKEIYMWNYVCDCGNTGSSIWSNLFREKKKFKQSCGCNKTGMRETLLLNKEGLKKCHSCGEILELNNFHVNKITLTGLASSCKTCKSISDSKYRKNPAQGRKSMLKKKLEYYQRIKIENPEKYKEQLKKRKESRDYSQEYQRMKSNDFLTAKDSIRKLLLATFKVRNICKSKLLMRTEEIIGCDFEYFKLHLESQFKEGMNWSNHGKWHIDHKVPLKVGKNIDELIKLNHYTNFQPLWAQENLTKNGRVLPEHDELHFRLLGRDRQE